METHRDNYCQTGSSLNESSENPFSLDSDEYANNNVHDDADASEISSMHYQMDTKSDESANLANKMGIVDSMPQVSNKLQYIKNPLSYIVNVFFFVYRFSQH